MSNLKVDLNDAELAIQKALGLKGYGVNVMFQTWADGWLIHAYDETSFTVFGFISYS